MVLKGNVYILFSVWKIIVARPTKSVIRQNIIEILHYLGEGYGYQIAKIYNEVFPPVTMRSVYYHLRKGVQTGELNVHKIGVEKGEFSWGDSVEKIYYTIGRYGDPVGLAKVKKFVKPHKVVGKKKGLLSRWKKK